ncbi:Ethanolamine kinase 2 [Lemmus lemmus]
MAVPPSAPVRCLSFYLRRQAPCQQCSWGMQEKTAACAGYRETPGPPRPPFYLLPHCGGSGRHPPVCLAPHLGAAAALEARASSDQGLPSTDLLFFLPLPSLSADVPKVEELSWLKEHLSQLESPVVFCHNDLLWKNIIYDSAKGTAPQAPQASHFFWALWALIQNQFSTTSFDFLR